MKKILKKYWLLILIASLALALRVYKVGEYPVGLTWDEPALGYNAYSILKTGRDEYGQFLPLTFKSFGDYKPGLFIYLLVPFVALFGLNKFAIRLPSALIGTATVVALFFLVQEIFAPQEKKSKTAYLSALLLAISPWNIHFSRGAWEVNLALFAIVLGVIFFLKSLPGRQIKFLLAAFFSFAVAFWVYHGAKVFLLPLLVGILFFFWPPLKKLPPSKKKLGLVLLVLLLAPLFTSFKGSANRARVMSLFSYTRPQEDIAEIVSQEEILPQANYFLYHGELLNFVRGFTERYLNHFTAKFLFFEGDWASPRHSTPYLGMMSYLELPLLLLGLVSLWLKKKSPQESLLFWWLIVAPVPAAITRDIIHGVRSYWLVIPLVIFAARGIEVFLAWWQKKFARQRLIAPLILVFGYLFCLTTYLDLYYFVFPYKNSTGWNYGADQVAQIIKDNKDQYEKIVVTQKYGQPYMFYLFYTRYPPAEYQKQAYLTPDPQGDVGSVAKLDNIEFRNTYWPEDRKKQNYLFIDDKLGLSDEDLTQVPQAKLLKEILFLDGRVAYRVVELR